MLATIHRRKITYVLDFQSVLGNERVFRILSRIVVERGCLLLLLLSLAIHQRRFVLLLAFLRQLSQRAVVHQVLVGTLRNDLPSGQNENPVGTLQVVELVSHQHSCLVPQHPLWTDDVLEDLNGPAFMSHSIIMHE